MNRLFYCAGNHDLLRDAACYDQETGKYIARQNVVRELAKQQDIPGHKGCLPSDDTVKFSLLTASTFRPFFEMLESLRRDPDEIQEVNNFEGTVFHLKACEDSTGPDIRFAAINTALLAGNVDSVNPNEIQTSWLKMQASVDVQEKCQAVKDYYDLLQKQAGRVINDDKKLCMPSENALDTLRKEIRKGSSYIGIMLGHHHYDLLCDNAKKAFNAFVKDCGIKLYLCGHTHVPDSSSIPTNTLYHKECNFHIHVSSGAFFSEKDYYSSLGFSIHTISRSKDDKYFFQSQNIAYLRLPEMWMDINGYSQNTSNRFELSVSKMETPTITIETPQSEDDTESIEYIEDENPLMTSDTDDRRKMSKNRTCISETKPSAHTTLSSSLADERIEDENPLMNTDCKTDHIIVSDDERIRDAERKPKNNGRGVDEADRNNGLSPDQLPFFKSVYRQLPNDILTPSDSLQKREKTL